jgi:cation-transporting ATPase G
MGQNLFLSGSILAVLVPLAATGLLGLAAVVAVHELAEVVVIANGIRAGRRGAFAGHTVPASDDDPPTDVALAGECDEGCCARPATVPLTHGSAIAGPPGAH